MINARSNARIIGMTQYRQRVGHLRCPSLLQAHAFAEHVAAAHSWYKQLHVKSGYGGFAFYLDPDAGKDIWQDADGEIRIVPRLPEDTPIHHSWMTTEATIEKFGHVNYCRYLPGHSSTSRILDGSQFVCVPDELLQQTYVECTALIHPRSQSLGHMFRFPNYRELLDADVVGQLRTPQEYRLAEILRLANEDYASIDDLQDEYAGIVSGIRNSYIQEMVNAIGTLGKIMTGENHNA